MTPTPTQEECVDMWRRSSDAKEYKDMCDKATKSNKYVTVTEKDGIEYVTMSKGWFDIRIQADHTNGMLKAYKNMRNVIKEQSGI